MSGHYFITLPSGESRGPVSYESVVELVRGGGLPPEARLTGGGGDMTVAELSERLSKSSAGAPNRARGPSTGERQALIGTVAASPQAISVKKLK